MNESCPENDRHESVAVAKFLLASAAATGADPHGIVREASLSSDALTEADARVPSPAMFALWELTDRVMEVKDTALTMAGQYRLGALDLLDYLATSAPTLGEAMRLTLRYLPFISTNCRLELVEENDRETTYAFSHFQDGGPATDLSERFSLAVLCIRANEATRQLVRPVHVGFAQEAPRRHADLAELFSARQRLDFGQATGSFTFRTSDLRLPIATADPALHAILRRYADTLPLPTPETWESRFRRLLTESLADGTVGLDAMARRLAVSPRTLQRRLADAGTTWRAELDAARRTRAEKAARQGGTPVSVLADRLGYSDARSLRRARRRWEDVPATPQA
ncbi:hypothetical protein BLA24_03425 [Streptomyces cinnamoneus]|uniref:HTH araC/xylS-type domain-containing protein n=1 Tax=Streptomyces cinnamoneus TaxID=53446 RepID=A0A2G1XPC9_STRCJ|nr:AraC family transcriptional regulator [Streptomyces cinnamoneus]PHQ50559.1 hypothetical protein BLA24_17230 [Streptomyces cinnamoneus]PHQ53105.1 hypothetical protein BLA24_03425 [Streptomyces cinnamoneus]PPT14187.1 AraC family transcriptional regulator [Streptomyces cinnamoneus]